MSVDESQMVEGGNYTNEQDLSGNAVNTSSDVSGRLKPLIRSFRAISIDENQMVEEGKNTYGQNLNWNALNTMPRVGRASTIDFDRSKVIESLKANGAIAALSRPDVEAMLGLPAAAAAFSSPACIAALTSPDVIAAISLPCATVILSSPIDIALLSSSAAVEFFSSNDIVRFLFPGPVKSLASPKVLKVVSENRFVGGFHRLVGGLNSITALGLVAAVAIITEHPAFVASRHLSSPPTVQAKDEKEEKYADKFFKRDLDPDRLSVYADPIIADPEFLKLFRKVDEAMKLADRTGVEQVVTFKMDEDGKFIFFP